jgi:hypothetical protein
MLAVTLALLFQFHPALATDQLLNAVSEPDSDVIERIVGCLNTGREAVLLHDRVECTKYKDGSAFLKEQDSTMPLKLDVAKVCDDSKDKPKDWRRLSNTAIKRIAVKLEKPYNSLGIRVLGAIFCEQVDLIGLDLPYSLVIDQSLLRGGFEARNFHTRGDLSFDGSMALHTIWVSRSRVDGTIFGNGAHIEKLQILDSEIHGSLIFRESVLPEPAIFDTVALSGELSMRRSALSYFVLQFSKVGGVLDLTESQATCAYVVRKTEIGDLVAVNAGFGVNKGADRFYWRLDHEPADFVQDAIKARRTRTSAADSDCAYWKIALPGAFRLFDTHVRSSLCLRSFQWLTSRRDNQATSFVTFADLNVGATTFIDLGNSRGSAQARDGGGEKHKFETVGLATHSLILNFDTRSQPDEMSMSGLGFVQVYAAADVQCAYDPKYYERPTGDVELRLDNVSDPRSQLRLPRVNEVMSWLNSNCLATTQPFAAFVEAAQKSGNDTDAKKFRIARANKELLLRISRAFGTAKTSNCSTSAEQKVEEDQSQTGVIWKAVTFLNDMLAIAFGILLWAVAQHGYRPEQAGFFVLATLVGAGVYFWLWTRVVGFIPSGKDTVRPIGAMFLFDRLLPAYRIREEHYNIESFYRRASRRSGSNGKTLKYLWFKIPVVKASKDDARRAERCLDVVKAIGLVLIIFLVAAINALFGH